MKLSSTLVALGAVAVFGAVVFIFMMLMADTSGLDWLIPSLLIVLNGFIAIGVGDGLHHIKKNQSAK
ncbi:hypothetical protein DES38_12010 [Streptohalobacillus salinus]|uniref:Uncharacterized protein n=1 Tax=Streptohalobacillus salinus TaxID=621096 RepID=A0A2V3VWW3_9BACI|nr:hypothetical protein [Streptohalobacillus salinus]PXW86477.1 hypothetical protein DES38_12010 [Streptohalobacillus salinus]